MPDSTFTPVSMAISVLSLFISGATAWLTLLRRGTVRMTQPMVIFLGPDAPGHSGESPLPKVYLRTLLFATSRRGRVVESMHVAIARQETRQNFNIWVYGDDKLVRGSGLYISETGIATNHHFLAPRDAQFSFVAGHYQLKVFAHLLGDRKLKQLFSQEIEITAEIAGQLATPAAGLYLDWGPDSQRYIPHVDSRPGSSNPAQILELLRGIGAPAERPTKPDW